MLDKSYKGDTLHQLLREEIKASELSKTLERAFIVTAVTGAKQ